MKKTNKENIKSNMYSQRLKKNRLRREKQLQPSKLLYFVFNLVIKIITGVQLKSSSNWL
jgi:hypothetical protein